MKTFELEILREIWQAKGYTLFTWAENHSENEVRFSALTNKPVRLIFLSETDAMMFALAHSKIVLSYYNGN